MDYSFSDELFKAILNLFWNILTWGWIAEIIFFFFCVVAVLYFVMILSNWQLVKVLVGDKFYYFKGLLYFWIREKYYFTKGYIEVIFYDLKYWSLNQWIVVIIFILVIIIVIGVIIFFITSFGGEAVYNETLNELYNQTNISL